MSRHDERSRADAATDAALDAFVRQRVRAVPEAERGHEERMMTRLRAPRALDVVASSVPRSRSLAISWSPWAAAAVVLLTVGYCVAGERSQVRVVQADSRQVQGGDASSSAESILTESFAAVTATSADDSAYDAWSL